MGTQIDTLSAAPGIYNTSSKKYKRDITAAGFLLVCYLGSFLFGVSDFGIHPTQSFSVQLFAERALLFFQSLNLTTLSVDTTQHITPQGALSPVTGSGHLLQAASTHLFSVIIPFTDPLRAGKLVFGLAVFKDTLDGCQFREARLSFWRHRVSCWS